MGQPDLTNAPPGTSTQAIDRVALGVLACARQVCAELGAGRPLEDYESALARSLRASQLKYAQQYPFGVPFDGPADKGFYADFIVEGWTLLELKTVEALTPEHVNQALEYLRESGARLCLLINFGKPELEFRRLVPANDVNHA